MIAAAAAIVAGLVALAFGVLFYQGRRMPQGKAEYVALGSSFAAGLGLGPRAPGSPLVSMRSTNGYPAQLARRLGLSLVDMSSSGATARHVLHGGQVFIGSQLRPLGKDTELVTITAGGNDIAYVGDLTFLAARRGSSLMGWGVRQFWKGAAAADVRDYGRVRADMLAIIREIQRLSPRARIVVVTYPLILPPDGTCNKLAITADEAATMREVGERLAQATRAAVQEGGAMLVDMQVLGASHHACSPEPWVNGWTEVAGAQFHPTLAGAKATAEALAGALGS